MKDTRLQPEGREAFGLYSFHPPRRNVGQQLSQRLPSLAARGLSLVAGQQEAKIRAQAAVDRISEVDLENFRRGLSLRGTPFKWILRPRQGYG